MGLDSNMNGVNSQFLKMQNDLYESNASSDAHEEKK